jgi:hypothetical protein
VSVSVIVARVLALGLLLLPAVARSAHRHRSSNIHSGRRVADDPKDPMVMGYDEMLTQRDQLARPACRGNIGERDHIIDSHGGAAVLFDEVCETGKVHDAGRTQECVSSFDESPVANRRW